MSDLARQIEWTPELDEEIQAWLRELPHIRPAYSGPQAGLAVFVDSMQRLLGSSYAQLKEKLKSIDAAIGALGSRVNPGETLEAYCARHGEPERLRNAMNDAGAFLQKECMRATHRIRRGQRLPESGYRFGDAGEREQSHVQQ